MVQQQSVRCCSVTQSCLTLGDPWTATRQASLSFTISHSFLKLTCIELMMPSNHLILCCPLSPPALNLSQHQSLFRGVSSSHQVTKVLELQLQHQSSNECSGLISVKVNWFALLAIQVTLKSSSITIQKHQFFGAQPSLWSNSHLCTWLLENHSFDYMDLCWQNDVYAF